MKRFVVRRLVIALCASGSLALSPHVMASAFQLWEQDGASVANYHAGYAALANDASIAWYNPAGIIRIKNQQVVIGGAAILSSFKYEGTIGVNTINAGMPRPVTAQGGTFGFVPNLHYVAPITDKIGFGFSIDVPFGLKTDYGNSTILRYASTKTSVTVVDVSPSLGFQVTDKASLGVGLDLQRMYAEFDLVGGRGSGSALDTQSTNKANGTAYGYHLGGLYQFTPDTRLGLSYHSQVVHHLSGSSLFDGPLASAVTRGRQSAYSSRATANITLPPYTALSLYHKLHPQVALMGSVIYTQWSTFKNLILNNISGIQMSAQGPRASRTIQTTIPEHYRNTWNISVGSDYYVTDKITLRGAVGYDQTPVQNAYRNVALPDNNRYAVALGGHYQATKAVGVDLGWTHLFINKAHINPPPQQAGVQVTTTNGSATGGADVYGAQITWDIA